MPWLEHEGESTNFEHGPFDFNKTLQSNINHGRGDEGLFLGTNYGNLICIKNWKISLNEIIELTSRFLNGHWFSNEFRMTVRAGICYAL